MKKVKLTLEMDGDIEKAEHDGVLVVAIDRAADGGINVSAKSLSA